MHKSRIGVIVIDCETDDLNGPLDFWSKALGVSGEIDADGKYAALEFDSIERRNIDRCTEY